MCVPYDFLKLKLASESDSAVKTVEKYYLPSILPIYCFRILGHGGEGFQCSHVVMVISLIHYSTNSCFLSVIFFALVVTSKYDKFKE